MIDCISMYEGYLLNEKKASANTNSHSETTGGGGNSGGGNSGGSSEGGPVNP